MSSKISTLATAVCAAAALQFCAPLTAQYSNLERDVEFVRNMARKMRFISLAQSEVERMKLHYKNRGDSLAIDQLGVEIALIGARLDPNRESKRTLYKEAIERCQEVLTSIGTGPVALAARMTLAEAAGDYGRFLFDEAQLARTENPEKVEDLETEAAEAFRVGEDACDAAMKDLQGKEDVRSRGNFFYIWLTKGILLREHARAVKKDSEYLTTRSRETLEELIFEIGEGTVLGQKALFEYAKNDEVLGDLDAAVGSYNDVISSTDSALSDEEIELGVIVREQMVQTLEEAYARIAAVRLEQGDVAKVLATLEKYREHLDRLDVPLTDLDNPAANEGQEDTTHGHNLYLSAACAMAESGDQEKVSKALKLVQYLNTKHPADYVGIRAKAVLKDITDAREDIVTGALLFEVAKGRYQDKDFEPAIQGLRRAIGAMNNDEATQLALDAYYMMGNSLAQQGRVLEATYALLTGLNNHGATAPEDLQRKAASLLGKTMRQVRTNTQKADTKYFDSLDDQVLRAQQSHGGGTDVARLSWNKALAKINDREYDEAVSLLSQIKQGTRYFEWAQVRKARALQRKGDFTAARKALADYRTFLETKEALIPDDRADLRQVRAIAEGEAAFYEASMVYEEAMGSPRVKKRDLTKVPDVVKLLSDFEPQHGKAVAQIVPFVNYMLGRAYVEMGNMAKAEERYRVMQKESPTSPNIPVLATAIFSAYDDQITAKTTEIEALMKDKDRAAVKNAEGELVTLRRRTLAIGLEYFASDSSPQYSICKIALDQAEAVKDWDTVETFGGKVVAQFEKDPAEKSKVDKFLRPLVAQALLRKHKYQQAHDMLVAAEKAAPNNYPVKRLLALTLGGWQELDENGKVRAFAGMGQPAKAYEIYWKEYKKYALSAKTERYSLEWYRFYWECYNFARAASQSDSQFVARAKTLYGKAESTDDFDTLRNLGREGEELYQLFLDNRP